MEKSKYNTTWETRFYSVADAELEAMIDSLPDELKIKTSIDGVLKDFF